MAESNCLFSLKSENAFMEFIFEIRLAGNMN